MEEPRRNIRIVIIGDDIVGAGGDPKGLGWVGRVIAKTQSDYPKIDFYVLSTPEISTAQLSDQWLEEASKRFASDTDNRLIVALNSKDIKAGITMSRSRLNLANILDTAISKAVDLSSEVLLEKIVADSCFVAEIKDSEGNRICFKQDF